MRVLDQSFFTKKVPISAAIVFHSKDISSTRARLRASGDLLSIWPINSTRNDETKPGRKCLLLRPGIDADDRGTWTPTISELVKEDIAGIRSYDLKLTYDDWPMHSILEAVLPEFPDEEKETPAGFACVGHVAHVNLREQYLPFRHLIGQVIVDKNPNIKTVINKIEDVGTESIYRTFPYEVLAGPNDMNVTVSESDCFFEFDFGKVYWNSRLNTEHKRMTSKFREGETVCDVMAGVGPFAVPAGKRKVFVWANDLNPDSYKGLEKAISRNKVGQFVLACCMDGRKFIRKATQDLPSSRRLAEVVIKSKASSQGSEKIKNVPPIGRGLTTATKFYEPASFDHYVMNLPATAVEFLDAFRGTYLGRENEFQSHTERKLPMVHVYLFTPRMETEDEEHVEVCKRVSTHLGYVITPDTPEVELFDVRLVSPKKKMYCASFRLPSKIAFAKEDSQEP